MQNKKLKWIIVFVTIVGTFLAMLDTSTINIALYDISQTLNEPITSVQWVVVGYMLILTAFLPFFGKLSEVCHRNQLYSAGFLVYALGSLLCFFSHTLPLLIASRCVQAIGASILVSNSVSIIASLFRGAKRGKAQCAHTLGKKWGMRHQMRCNGTARRKAVGSGTRCVHGGGVMP